MNTRARWSDNPEELAMYKKAADGMIGYKEAAVTIGVPTATFYERARKWEAENGYRPVHVRERRKFEPQTCSMCGGVDNRIRSGKRLCNQCVKKTYLKQLDQKSERRRERRSENKCGVCGKQDERTELGYSLCSECAKLNHAAQARHNTLLTAENRCHLCGRQDGDTLAGRYYCAKCSDSRRIYYKARVERQTGQKEPEREAHGRTEVLPAV